MENDIAELIADIEKVSCLINMQGKHHVFVYNSGHIKTIEVRFYLRGWEHNADPYLSNEVSYDMEDDFDFKLCVNNLKRIRDTLRKIYKNGKININNFDYEIKEIKMYKFRSNY